MTGTVVRERSSSQRKAAKTGSQVLRPDLATSLSTALPSAVYVRYRDHVLFKNCTFEAIQPAVRETVGWIARQDETAIWLVNDRSCFDKPLAGKESVESGLVILRSDILELRQIC